MGNEDQFTSADQTVDIVIEPVEETPRDQEIGIVAGKARTDALARLKKSTSLVDYLRWCQAAIFATPASIAWMWDYGGITPEEIIEDQESENFTQMHRINAVAAEAMRLQVEKLSPTEGMIRIALKRVRDKDSTYTYRVLASFPDGVAVSDPLGGSSESLLQQGSDTYFFKPEIACVSHACDDLFREHRDEAFYMPYKSVSEAIANLQTINNALNEYMLGKIDTKKITQDPHNYLLVALLGGYSNEKLRVKISDFWNKAS